MKCLISLQLLFFSFVALIANAESSFNLVTSSDTIKQISKAKFNSHLVGLDTITIKQEQNNRKAVSCSWGTYKLINSNYVLHINTQLLGVRFEKFYEVNINSTGSSKIAELLVYDKSNASLESICSDVVAQNSPVASKQIIPISGKLFIGFLKPKHSYDQFDITIFIVNLQFKDPITNRLISFSNESIWKIVYEGIPG